MGSIEVLRDCTWRQLTSTPYAQMWIPAELTGNSRLRDYTKSPLKYIYIR